VALQPVNQAAWLWLSAVAPDKAEAESALAQAKNIDPAHSSLPRAEQWFVHRFSPAPTTKKSKVAKPPSKSKSKQKTSKSRFRIFNSVAIAIAVAALLVGLLVLVLGLIWEVSASAQPKAEPNANTMVVFEKSNSNSQHIPGLDDAWANQNWAGAITLLETAYQLQPASQTVKEKLAQAHLQNGLTLREKGFIEEALINFEAAIRIHPEQVEARQQVTLASAYLAGVEHYQAGRWQEAALEFEKVLTGEESYSNIRDMLYSAHYNSALARQGAGEPAEAKHSLEVALALRPDLSEPRRLLAEIEFAMAPQTALELTTNSPKNKMIVVGIAEQRMRVFDNNKEVFDFVVSTGEPGRETAIGEFEILNKIDVAYASTWNLDMPYWMGIYWAGPLQNGIHSLPIVKHTGYKLWDGYLGQRVSYGCVILSDEDAATLYDWAVVGTKVKIVPSLANWSPEN
jgi:tetratricopeptide (TPR) repeat protein